jgi:Ca2+-binding EF-hand superfamily protein
MMELSLTAYENILANNNLNKFLKIAEENNLENILDKKILSAIRTINRTPLTFEQFCFGFIVKFLKNKSYWDEEDLISYIEKILKVIQKNDIKKIGASMNIKLNNKEANKILSEIKKFIGKEDILLYYIDNTNNLVTEFLGIF